jgi:hypothetical protein
MLAEKFILMLEARIRSGQYLDGSQHVYGQQRAMNPVELLTIKVVVKMMAGATYLIHRGSHPDQRRTILDKPLGRNKTQVS